MVFLYLYIVLNKIMEMLSIDKNNGVGKKLWKNAGPKFLIEKCVKYIKIYSPEMFHTYCIAFLLMLNKKRQYYWLKKMEW